MKKIIELPIIICGKIIDDFSHDTVDIEYSNDVVIRMPALTEEYVETILNNHNSLANESLYNVSEYVQNGSIKWSDRTWDKRQEAVQLCSQITGYSLPMIEHDYSLIGGHFCHRNVIYDMLDSEFGTWRVLDEWVRNDMAKIRAYPIGRTFHIMVGNVPMAGIFSIIRSIITKNQTIVKLPARDLVTCLYYCLGLIESNKGKHDKISESISVFYCPKESPFIERIANNCNMVCAWGKGSSIAGIKQMLNENVSFLGFGPKYSFSLVYDDECDMEAAALRIAHDMCIYDQEACFSPQHLFIKGDPHKIIAPLSKWLNIQEKSLPKSLNTIDNENHLLRVRMEAKLYGWDIYEGETWTLIINSPYERIEQPLGRTMFIHSIDSIDDVKDFVDDNVQTVSVYPYDKRVQHIADTIAPLGAVRFCECGAVSYPRDGWTHDGMYALKDFVHMVCIDDAISKVSKYATKDQMKMVLYEMFGRPEGDFFDHIIMEEDLDE